MVDQDHVLDAAASRLRRVFLGVLLFSGLVNLLMLTGPMFMLQVYDRVLASRSVPTLSALFVLVIVLYVFLGFFDLVRSRLLSRAGYWFEEETGATTFRTFIVRGLSTERPEYRPLADVAVLRGWLAGPGPMALFDLPWTPAFLLVVTLLHPWLGALAGIGALLVVALALLNQLLTRRALADSALRELDESRFAQDAERNADLVLSMGMLEHVCERWHGLRAAAAARAQHGGERVEVFASISKAFRLLLQSAILGFGAWLAIHGEMSPGMIVAASIIAGRALAPIDQAIGGWRTTQRAWLGWRRLRAYLERSASTTEPPLPLPTPAGRVQVHGATKLPPTPHPADPNPRPILADVSFCLEPGDGLGVIGQSACGKSTLARLLVGLWLPDRGSVRLDGATHQQWDPQQLGPHLGYLPQQVSLFAGTIAENIARFDPQADPQAVIAAASLVGVHDMILALPDGYSTRVGTRTCPLSGGQLQRIGLARAVYGRPRFVVLDEPNSNLDADGDGALAAGIRSLRESGSTVVVMAHRPSAIAAVDLLLMLKEGRPIAYGPKHEVLHQVTRPVPDRGSAA